MMSYGVSKFYFVVFFLGRGLVCYRPTLRKRCLGFVVWVYMFLNYVGIFLGDMQIREADVLPADFRHCLKINILEGLTSSYLPIPSPGPRKALGTAHGPCGRLRGAAVWRLRPTPASRRFANLKHIPPLPLSTITPPNQIDPSGPGSGS